MPVTNGGWIRIRSRTYVEYESGVWVWDKRSNETEHVWQEPLCHAHSDASGRYFVADQSPYFWAETPCQVLHFDRESGKRTAIASALPEPPLAHRTGRGTYHVDPHPQFASDWIVWTSTVDGRITVALTPAAALH